ncbi:alpha-glucuronidase family glycosyl hydrolase [uncultured Bacteroides sp.]|uniref:alpha-glucuronidase family glycosyl hydrolase n=1 Tax=uncultured Bacteroides sp. TaxID=162156 RepID=UPI00258F0804|nr:alpha-glucuronidase family glycosyl hydrolase [uncultured Bacteroides sp.]
MKKLLPLLFIICFLIPVSAENGSRLWLRYSTDGNASISCNKQSPMLDIATTELRKGWKGMPVTLTLQRNKETRALGEEGYCLLTSDDGRKITITSAGERGLLYGAFHLLRLQDTDSADLSKLDIKESPAYDLRILNHWDNLDRSIERGYAGRSLWDWEALPSTLSDRYADYARTNASIGINGTVINNVNASSQILSTEYLEKVKALADVFRPYGIRVYLSINFASPMQLGGLPTADPLDKEVIAWWKNKTREIYRLIPDFGGFLVKANSEGQPGPCDFNLTHAEGANMLADAVKPYKGIIMWRAFVYSPSDADRAKQAYLEFQPLDGQFRDNVIVQIKNGPVDFQPREPYSPLFGAMPKTAQMVEFQITQEYLGFSNHLAYLAPMWKEFFDFVQPSSLKAMAGVANIGTDANWCGHPFAQSNWYAFGRLAWNPELSSETIAEEWLKQTFFDAHNPQHAPIAYEVWQMMMQSREAVVDYMMPLGLHHLFAWGHHYGPEPWCDIPGARPDWMPSYYHKADKAGIGFDRSHTGSNATAQYPDSLCHLYDDINTCPDEYLLWFHHAPWNHTMQSGRTLWDELCYRYDRGVQQVRSFQKKWDLTENYIDTERFKDVQSRLKIQARDAVWWKDACLLYFMEYSGVRIPYDIERPIHELDDLKQVKLPIDNHECPTRKMLNDKR